MTLVEFLSKRCGNELVGRRCDAALAAAALRQTDGSVFVLVERTYREGLSLLEDVSEDELRILEGGDLWELWNSDRATWLGGVV